MALQVTLVKTPGGVSLSRTSHLFNEQGGTLGRSDNNTWVLPDPEKFLSSCHCEVLCVAGEYFLLDRSTNGTFLNDSPEPIGRGVKSRLAHGDIFDIGDYRFSVAVTDRVMAASPFDAPVFAAPPPASNDIFDSPFAYDSGAESAPLFDQPLDPLAVWDKATPAIQPQIPLPGGSPFVSNTAPSIDDIFGEPLAPTPTFAPVDISPSLDQAVAWPDTARENLIPEDWEDDLLDLAPKVRQEIPTPVYEQPIPVPTPAIKPRPVAVTPAAPFAMPVPEPVPVASVPVETPAPVVPVPSHAETTVTPVTPPLSSVTSAVDKALIQAMGLDVSRLTDEEMMHIATTTGLLMREVVDGLMSVLRSRASIKNEFRMNMTTIQPVENNPLKFSVSVDDALENMFLKKSNAYKKPVDAFKEGFQEIAQHQVAMIGGIRQGFERMMERFSPEGLERQFNKKGGNGIIPGLQKAKYWNCYTEYYSGLTDNMEYSFQQLFGSDFVNAYEDQLRRLSAAQKKDKLP